MQHRCKNGNKNNYLYVANTYKNLMLIDGYEYFNTMYIIIISTKLFTGYQINMMKKTFEIYNENYEIANIISYINLLLVMCQKVWLRYTFVIINIFEFI